MKCLWFDKVLSKIGKYRLFIQIPKFWKYQKNSKWFGKFLISLVTADLDSFNFRQQNILDVFRNEALKMGHCSSKKGVYVYTNSKSQN